jgi:hypothetical protein
MKTFSKKIFLAMLALLMSGCLTAVNSPVGVRCDSSVEKGPYWEWPLACQPNGGG